MGTKGILRKIVALGRVWDMGRLCRAAYGPGADLVRAAALERLVELADGWCEAGRFLVDLHHIDPGRAVAAFDVLRAATGGWRADLSRLYDAARADGSGVLYGLLRGDAHCAVRSCTDYWTVARFFHAARIHDKDAVELFTAYREAFRWRYEEGTQAHDPLLPGFYAVAPIREPPAGSCPTWHFEWFIPMVEVHDQEAYEAAVASHAEHSAWWYENVAPCPEAWGAKGFPRPPEPRHYMRSVPGPPQVRVRWEAPCP